jgi:hypothetical protein
MIIRAIQEVKNPGFGGGEKAPLQLQMSSSFDL